MIIIMIKCYFVARLCTIEWSANVLSHQTALRGLRENYDMYVCMYMYVCRSRAVGDLRGQGNLLINLVQLREC